MKIFKQEELDGIAEQVSASSSIAYASVAEPCKNTARIKSTKSLASFDDSDLYYVQSILVSSSWNKNDDIFDKQEVWAARRTPEDKPTNLEHDENTIIGHITSNWPITEDGVIIDDNTDTNNLPDKYHILTGSVIYKAFASAELRERAAQLIREIEDGEKYVSMECFFKNFDYGLLNKSTGKYSVLARNEDTAYLTKHLRAYGGLGEHEDYKIGRVLRNITFSGKGFVNRPANPDSVIFSKNLIPTNQTKSSAQKTIDFVISGVSNNQSNLNVENYTMNVDQEIADLKSKVEAMADCSAATKEAYAAVAELKDKIVALESTIQTKDTEILSLKTSYDELVSTTEAAKQMKEEEMKKAKSELDAALEAVAAYKMKEEEMMKKEKKMKRMASLMEVGVDNDTASATVDKFDALDDEAFAAMTAIFASKKVATQPVAEAKTESRDNTNTESLEEVEVENELNLGVASDADDAGVQTTRAALVEFVCQRLGKNLNKGE